ncbi:hypothetical protein [Ferviditalea candida]|uniref:MAPEG family protein n=1 Tax=Ferviditalea candida TaxID=3108399 RepID=A0ABU5ZJ87_9BACL|nr:hypothetical protein [Paenibacillaceae bacterium T2]
MPNILVELAWLVVLVRSVYMIITMVTGATKPWFQIVFNSALAVISLSFLLPWFQ